MAAMIAFLSVDCCALAPLQDTGVYADVLSIDMSLLWHAHFLTPLSILFLNAISSLLSNLYRTILLAYHLDV
jgi:hypothetical protein